MRIWNTMTSKLKISYSIGVFKLSPTAFRVWLLLEHDKKLRNFSYVQIAGMTNLNPATIRNAMPAVSATYKEPQTLDTYHPS
jgi:hypothetical protein